MHAAPAVPGHPVKWTTTDAFIVLLAAQLISFVWAGSVIGSIYGSDVPDEIPIALLMLLNVGLWFGYGLGPVIVSRRKGRGPGPDFGAQLRPTDLGPGLAIGVLTQVVVLPILYFPLLRFIDGDPSDSARTLVDSIDGPIEAGLFTLSVVVMAPLVEELFFRGLLLRSMQTHFGTATAIIGSAALFAAVHRQLLPFPGLFVFGVFAAVLAVRTGRLGPSWAMHAGFNGTTLVLLTWF